MQESLQVYRVLLRSAARAFKGDAPMLTAARKEIRSNLEASRVETDPQKVQQLQAEGREAAEFLSTYIVQASLNKGGNYEMKINEEHINAYAEPITPGMRLPREKGGSKA